MEIYNVGNNSYVYGREVADALRNKVRGLKTKKEKLEFLELLMEYFIKAPSVEEETSSFCFHKVIRFYDTDLIDKAYNNTLSKHVKGKRLEPRSNYDVYLKNKRIAERFGLLGVYIDENLMNISRLKKAKIFNSRKENA